MGRALQSHASAPWTEDDWRDFLKRVWSMSGCSCLNGQILPFNIKRAPERVVLRLVPDGER